MKRSRLDRTISERISLAVQASLGCALCIDAHADGARRAGGDDGFGRRAHLEPSSVSIADIDELRGLGYRDRDILDVVGLVALNVLTGSFNLVAGLEPTDLAEAS